MTEWLWGFSVCIAPGAPVGQGLSRPRKRVLCYLCAFLLPTIEEERTHTGVVGQHRTEGASGKPLMARVEDWGSARQTLMSTCTVTEIIWPPVWTDSPDFVWTWSLVHTEEGQSQRGCSKMAQVHKTEQPPAVLITLLPCRTPPFPFAQASAASSCYPGTKQSTEQEF